MHSGYGPLVEDPAGFLDLPAGFGYRILSSLGDPMSDGGQVPDRADGMGCFDIGGGRLALVRNHELTEADDGGGDLTSGFDRKFGEVLPGGTTHVILSARTLNVQRQFRSLAGTIRNCAGGVTPWGSWLSCEEAPVAPGGPRGDGLERAHGWVFEVPALATGLVPAEPLTALGRFNHEAACVDPASGIVYLTEDRDDGVLYRFVPHTPGELGQGGRLQAMQVVDVPDSRNWSDVDMAIGSARPVRWIDLAATDAPDDDLRHRAATAGATLVARGEGIHMGPGEIYVCSTSGGAAKLGQIFRLVPGGDDEPDRFELFFESTSIAELNFGDNLTVAPNGHLIVCEDQYTDPVDNYLRGISPRGASYPIARLRRQTELAGACFSPDGRQLFVNAYSPTRTLAIEGPWASIAAV